MLIDKNGIPSTYYGFKNNQYIGKQQSILAVGEWALFLWNNHLKDTNSNKVELSYDWNVYPNYFSKNSINKTVALKYFENCITWLVEQVNQENNYLWQYPYPSPYGHKKGWLSAHTQSLSTLALIKGYELLKKETLRNIYMNSLKAFYLNYNEGGLKYEYNSTSWWYLKFATTTNNELRILNGMLFTLLHLVEINKVIENIHKPLISKGINAVTFLLPHFDTGSWSYYDNKQLIAGDHYHSIHASLLKKLSQYTNSSKIHYYSKLFNQYTITNGKRVR